MFTSLKTLFSTWWRILIYIVLVGGLLILWWSTTDMAIMFGNYGYVHTSLDIALSLVMILFFPLFLIALIYKSYKFWKRANINWKTSTGIVWGIIGTIISGASCCGATLAATLWLIPIMSLLPYDGLEIKIIGTLGLLYALYDILTHLETCKIRKK